MVRPVLGKPGCESAGTDSGAMGGSKRPAWRKKPLRQRQLQPTQGPGLKWCLARNTASSAPADGGNGPVPQRTRAGRVTDAHLLNDHDTAAWMKHVGLKKGRGSGLAVPRDQLTVVHGTGAWAKAWGHSGTWDPRGCRHARLPPSTWTASTNSCTNRSPKKRLPAWLALELHALHLTPLPALLAQATHATHKRVMPPLQPQVMAQADSVRRRPLVLNLAGWMPLAGHVQAIRSRQAERAQHRPRDSQLPLPW